MGGMVIINLGGGDFTIVSLDAERWAQVEAAWRSVAFDVAGVDEFKMVVSWLASDDEDDERPDLAPERREGKIVCELYAQSPVIERKNYPAGVGVIVLD